MILYQANKEKFMKDVQKNDIHVIVEQEFFRRLHKKPAPKEVESWRNSLQSMFVLLTSCDLPATAGVAIEYNIPLSGKRVDFILTGKDKNREDKVIIIELKQWSEVWTTTKDAIVETYLGGGKRETNHPSYQAWSYAVLIEDYNETVRDEKISLHPCAYLHNLQSDTAVNDPFYSDHIDKAPVFISKDVERLAKFLEEHIKFGDSDDIMYRVDNGKIKPSKRLADSLGSMLAGNDEFLMIDDQKLVYETALDLAYKTGKNEKHVLIVKGGPGTGKSVVAINLLVELTKREKVVNYVTKNAAPRGVFAAKLSGTMRKTEINYMFKGSGAFNDTEAGFFDALIVDEAHRLNEKSGLYSNKGENQVKETIHSSKLSVFFIDEAQRIHIKDIGSVNEIKKWSEILGANVTELELESQFRCNGSDGYLAWLDNVLGIRDTAHFDLSGVDYDVKVFDDPNLMRDAIIEKNRLSNNARMVAGYCWDWKSKKDSTAMDIVIPEHNFEAQWNLGSDGSLWIIAEESVHQVGCIHTCQGLEVDYIGVFIGKDFLIRDGEIVTNGLARPGRDATISGFRKLLKKEPVKAKAIADEIIKNTYRTLMSRGHKGCYIYCDDKETNEYFKSFVSREVQQTIVTSPYPGLNHNVLERFEITPYTDGFVPLIDIQAAAGNFSDFQLTETPKWVQVPEYINVQEDMFVIQIVGESMNKRIPNGSWCLFKLNPGGTRNGKVVLVQHREIADPDHGGSYTVKLYESMKVETENGLVNTNVILKPDTNAYGYANIEIKANEQIDLNVIGEFIVSLN